jgi:phage shock protein PspC (stress-responsive transcriptional regulator)
MNAPVDDTQAEPAFFVWLHGLGVPRRPGWIGGVCAGIAARVGVDPIVIRGLAVVAAILAAPALFLYAAAWLLLPGPDGRIILQRMLRGAFEPALIGIGILVIASFLPLAQTFWSFVAQSGIFAFWTPFGVFDPFPAFFGLWNVLATLALIALVVWLIVRAIRTPGGSGSVPVSRTASASATTAAQGGFAVSTPGEADAATAASTGSTAPAEPPAPVADADADGVADWRAQHEAWRREHAAWRASQAEADRVARAEWAAQNRAHAEQLRARAAEAHRLHRLANPRANGAFVVAVLGAALVGGAVAAITALGSRPTADHSTTIGLCVAALVVAFGMIVAALWRRRSGFLAFVAGALTIAALATALLPWTEWLMPPWWATDGSLQIIEYVDAITEGQN